MSEPIKPVATAPSTRKSPPAKSASRRRPAAKPTATRRATTKAAAPKVAAPTPPEPQAEPVVAEAAAPMVAEDVAVPTVAEEAAPMVAEDVAVPTVAAEAAVPIVAEEVAVPAELPPREVETVDPTEKGVLYSTEQVEVSETVSGSLGLGVEEGLSFLKANMDAAGESTSVLVKGSQDLAILSFEYMRDMAEDSAKLGRALVECGGPDKVIEVKMTAAEKATEKTLAVGQKVTDLVGQMLEEAVAPLSARTEMASAAMSKVFSFGLRG